MPCLRVTCDTFKAGSCIPSGIGTGQRLPSNFWDTVFGPALGQNSENRCNAVGDGFASVRPRTKLQWGAGQGMGLAKDMRLRGSFGIGQPSRLNAELNSKGSKER